MIIGSKAHLQGKTTQLGVSDSFEIAVPTCAHYQDKLVRLGSAKMAGTSAPPALAITLPWMSDELVPNAFHDVIARDVTVKRR